LVRILSALFLFISSAIAGDSTNYAELKLKAEAGDAESQFQLGLRKFKRYNYYIDDYAELAKQNFEAEHWFQKAAAQGHTIAQYKLGMMYHPEFESLYGFTEKVWRARQQILNKTHPDSLEFCKGDYGIPYEMNAEKWLKRAAEGELPEAQHSLALYYMWGWGKDGSYLIAINWLEKAAQQDYTPAQLELGQTYSVPVKEIKDMARAHFWLSVASEKNDESSTNVLRNVKKYTTVEELNEAQKLLDEWHSPKK
jgi:TPR repeat protein